MDNKQQLTDEEVLFCELFVNGTAPYAGNAVKCYSEVYHTDGPRVRHIAQELLKREDIQTYVKELEEMSIGEADNMKRYLTQNLMKILEETSTAQYRDRRGTLLSPAPLRSVAVSAAKALMDMYAVKEAQTANLNIEGNGEGGITFNVIVPEQKPETEAEEEK